MRRYAETYRIIKTPGSNPPPDLPFKDYFGENLAEEMGLPWRPQG